jgi:two-component system chemotaxis response regulator CheB
MTPKRQRNIIVVGASAGGVEALLALVKGFPADLEASVFIAIHMRPGFPSNLPRLLEAAGPLPACMPVDGQPFLPGRIYVSTPDRHLLVREDRVNVERGPRENGHRPAVDALFRTAARAHGPRVIGVVMTGYLNCGTAGLLSIKARGGVAVVQNPTSAAVPDMPRSAIRNVAVDHIVPLSELPGTLTRLSRETASWAAFAAATGSEVAKVEGQGSNTDRKEQAEVACPNCLGQLTVSKANGFLSFRCHVGHAFSLQSLSAEQADEVERALWAAVRALEESAALSRRLADSTGSPTRQRFLDRQVAQSQHADVIRSIALGGDLASREDSYSIEGSQPRLAQYAGRTRKNNNKTSNIVIDSAAPVPPATPRVRVVGGSRSRSRSRPRH